MLLLYNNCGILLTLHSRLCSYDNYENPLSEKVPKVSAGRSRAEGSLAAVGASSDGRPPPDPPPGGCGASSAITASSYLVRVRVRVRVRAHPNPNPNPSPNPNRALVPAEGGDERVGHRGGGAERRAHLVRVRVRVRVRVG